MIRQLILFGDSTRGWGRRSRLAVASVLLLRCGNDPEPATAPAATMKEEKLVSETCTDNAWTLLTTAYNTACAQGPSGMKCWGVWGMYGAQGEFTGANVRSPGAPAMSFGGSTTVRHAASAIDSTCAAVDSGVWCWGGNPHGELGDGTKTSRAEPARVAADFGDHVVKLGSTAFTMCALVDDGSVWCWGANHRFQAGVATASVVTVTTPNQIDLDGRKAKDMVVGGDFGCIVSELDELLCWGSNEQGQLGKPGPNTARAVAVDIGVRKPVALGASSSSICATFDDQSTACWGANRYGELGLGDFTARSTPVNLDFGPDVGAPVDIDGGREHMCAVFADGSVKCWGKNSCWDVSGPEKADIQGGQLGIGVGSSAGVFTPTAVPLGDAKAVAIRAGMDDTCASFEDGSVKCWGCANPMLSAGSSHPAASTPAELTAITPAQLGPIGLGDAGLCVANTAADALAPIDVCRISEDVTSDDPPPTDLLFIYENRGTETIDTSIGVDNQFSGVADRGQPRAFPPGKGAFRVRMSPDGDTWTLGTKTLTASDSLPLCQIVEKGVDDEVQVGGRVYLVPFVDDSLAPEPELGEPDFGALNGSFGVSASGAATFAVPIAIPPGIAGMAPDLSLVYSSQEGNGVAGQGWNLAGLSTLSRCAKTMRTDSRSLPATHPDNDALCLDGRRLYRTEFAADTYAYHGDTNDFSITREDRDVDGNIAGYSIQRKSGVVHRYASRPENAVKLTDGGPTVIWLLDEVRDTFGNWYRVVYNNGQANYAQDGVRVTSIQYTGHGTEEPFYSIDFDYEQRPDPRFSYLGGLPIWRKHRLTSITTPRGVYSLSYLEDGREVAGHPSRLHHIGYETRDGIRPTPLTFDWDSSDVAFTETSTYALPADVDLVTYYNADAAPQQKSGAYFADVNGDALVDIVQSMDGKPQRAWRNTGEGWEEDAALALPTDHEGAFMYDSQGRPGEAELVDWDGDGKLDIVAGATEPVTPPGERYGMRVWLNRIASGGGWEFRPELSPKYTVSSGIGRQIRGEIYNFTETHRLIDFNGDGKVDILRMDQNEVTLNGAGRDEAYDMPDRVRDLYGDDTWRINFQDIDHDGLTDIAVRLGSADPNIKTWKYDIWRNTGHDLSDDSQSERASVWELTGDQDLPQMFADFYRVFNVDVNGDGRQDVVQFSDQVVRPNPQFPEPPRGPIEGNPFEPWEDYVANVIMATDTGPVRDDVFSSSLPPPVGVNGHSGYGNWVHVVQFSDLNADGLVDLLWGDRVRANSGASWNSVSDLVLPIVPQVATPADPYVYKGGNEVDNGARFFDLNGDGVLDLVRAEAGYDHKTWMNQARAPRIWQFPNGRANKTRASYTTLTSPDAKGTYVHEETSNAQAQSILTPMSVVKYVTEDAGVDTAAGSPDREREYKYRGLKRSARGLGSFGFHEVSVLDRETGIRTDTTYSQVYPYVGQVEHTTRTLIASGDVLSESVATYCDSQDRNDISGEVSCSSMTSGAGYRPAANLFVNPSSLVEKSYFDNGDWVSVTTNYEFDTFGNPTKTTVRTQGSNGDDATKVTELMYEGGSELRFRGKVTSSIETMQSFNPPAPALTHVTQFEYDVNTWFLTKQIDEAGQGTPYETWTVYRSDEYGNTIKTTVCADDLDNCAVDAVASRGALPYRSVETSFDPADLAVTGAPITSILEYGRGRFPVRVVNSVGHVQQFVYDPLIGEAIQSTAVDGLHTCKQFDGLGRLSSTTLACGTDRALTTTTESYEAQLAEVPAAVSVVVARPPVGRPKWSYNDRLGRKVAELTRSFDGGFVRTVTEYDRLGRVQRESAPTTAATPEYWTTTHYDDRGRLQQVDQQLGDLDGTGSKSISTVMIYTGFTTITTKRGDGLEERSSAEQRDSRGHVVLSYRLPAGDDDRTTFFAYDAEGNLTSVAAQGDPATELLRVTWDHGRKRTSWDSNTGTWTYGYDGFGQLVSQTDANGHTTQTAYDPIGRIEAKIGENGTSSWYYDDRPGPSNGKLKAIIGPPDDRLQAPCTVPDVGTGGDGNRAAKWFTYNAYGEIEETFECIDGEVFSTLRSFDQYGRTELLTYPEIQGRRSSVRYGYNASGYVASVSDADTGAELWGAREVDARGKVTREALGNGLEVASTRNPATGWLRTTDSYRASNGQSVASGYYAFDSVGNLLLRSQTAGDGESEDRFDYDLLDRVTRVRTAHAGQPIGSDTFSYDVFGNLLNKSGRQLHYGTCAGVHRLCSSGDGPEYEYDANGNLLRNDSHELTYGANNKVTHIGRVVSPERNASGNVDLTYDALDGRVVQQTTDAAGNASRTLYLGLDDEGRGLYERTATSSDVQHTQFLYVPGYHSGAFALRIVKEQGANTTRTVNYYHYDHLGSVVAVSDESGQVVTTSDPAAPAAVSYDTWGEQRARNGERLGVSEVVELPGRRGFTGHEVLAPVGLVNMNGRVYDPAIGRFLSADVTVQFPTNLQSYNRYSYALNNPLKYTDPTGYVVARYTPDRGGWWQRNGETVIEGVAVTGFCIATYASGGVACAAAVMALQAAHVAQALSDGADPYATIGFAVATTAVSIAMSGAGGAVTSWWQAALQGGFTAAITAGGAGIIAGDVNGWDMLIAGATGAVEAGATFALERSRLAKIEAARGAKIGAAAYERSRDSSFMTSLMQEVAREKGRPAPRLADVVQSGVSMKLGLGVGGARGAGTYHFFGIGFNLTGDGRFYFVHDWITYEAAFGVEGTLLSLGSGEISAGYSEQRSIFTGLGEVGVKAPLAYPNANYPGVGWDIGAKAGSMNGIGVEHNDAVPVREVMRPAYVKYENAFVPWYTQLSREFINAVSH